MELVVVLYIQTNLLQINLTSLFSCLILILKKSIFNNVELMHNTVHGNKSREGLPIPAATCTHSHMHIENYTEMRAAAE